MTEFTVNIRTDLGAMLAGLQRSQQRTIDLLSFGLLQTESAHETTLVLPGAHFQIATAGNERMAFETVRREFGSWILSNGLRESVESINSFLEEARSVCAYWTFAGQKSGTGTDWNERIVHEARRFHRFGLPDKIEHLKNRYDSSLTSELTESVLTINMARNCLVHRGGRVTERDSNTAEGLCVDWITLNLIVKGAAGERVIVPPADVSRGETLSIRQSRTKKLFHLGENLSFSAQEFSEICWTLFLFGKQLRTNIETYGRAKGVKFTEGSGENTG